MQSISKILIIERSCASLVTLIIWLTQFPELQVHGILSEQNLKKALDANAACNYDLILFGIEASSNEELPIEMAMALSLVCRLKAKENGPIIILLARHLSNRQSNNISLQISQQLLKEADGHISTTDSLLDFHDEITRLLSSRKKINLITTKAG